MSETSQAGEPEAGQPEAGQRETPDGLDAELGEYVETWWEAVGNFVELLESLPDDAWSQPTDLPGWDVRAVAAHIAHLECLTAGGEHDEVEVGNREHVRSGMGIFTEQGVAARGDQDPAHLIDEIRSCSQARHAEILGGLPANPSASAPGVFGSIGWDQRTLLRNRPLDVFMHEQDIRRALEIPGDFASRAARHATDYLMESFGYVVGKRVAAPAGTSVVLEVEGHDPVAVLVDDGGRANLVDVPADPTVSIHTDREGFLTLAGGRRGTDAVSVDISGDRELGLRILDRSAVTP